MDFWGFALFLAKATNFNKILKMLRLEDLSLAKIIIFAIGFSSVLLSLSNALGLFDISNLSVKTMNLGVVLGGLLFGFAFGSIEKFPSIFGFGFTGLFLVGVLFMIAAYFLPTSILKTEDK